MGIKSLLTSITLALVLAPAAGAQERGRSEYSSRALVSPSSYGGSHQELRGGSYGKGYKDSYKKYKKEQRKRAKRGYGKRSYREPQRIWVPGCNEWVTERFWVAETYERVWVEPVYGWSFDACGLRIRVCTQEGYWKRVCIPGHYETRRVQRYVPGHWKQY